MHLIMKLQVPAPITPPAPEPPAAPAPPHPGGPPPAMDPPPAPVGEAEAARGERWGKFIIGHRAATILRPATFWARCPFHLPQASRSGVSQLHCTKEMTVGRGACVGLDEAATLRRIKQWCVDSTPPSPASERKDHMMMHRRPINVDEIFNDDMLLNMRATWDIVDAVV